MFRNILIVILCLVFGFGFWYLIFWFVTTERNLFLWHWGTKTVYLLFAFASTQGSMDALLKNNN
jgi:predicted ABC-type exoprotein transport system permease subunit